MGPVVHRTTIDPSDSTLLQLYSGGSRFTDFFGRPEYLMIPRVPGARAIYAEKLVDDLRRIPGGATMVDGADDFLIHTGSRKIIGGVCRKLDIDAEDERVLTSYDVLRDNGNSSAASVGFIMAR